jgi:hypothetical protein
MIRLLAISGQLMAKEEEEEGIDKCLCNEANTRILAKLGDHMQSTMERLQNPPDCEKAQLLIFKVYMNFYLINYRIIPHSGFQGRQGQIEPVYAL